ncbi:MAG: hypothetical protein JSV88_17405 [Candidatus Aminicenantes bacterium]|nr:MAG: hypothetical protein JSV88_17405 [Candidatus Aminicenantes bacterium]
MFIDMIPEIIIAALILIFLVIAPLMIHSKLRMPARPEFAPMDPGGCPAGVLEFFNLSTRELEKEGFTVVADAVQTETGSLPNQTTYIRLLVNQKAGDAAMCAYSEVKIQNTKQVEKYVEFCTEFSTNKEVSTNNSKMPTIFKKFPEKQLFQFPNIKDLHYLYEIHTRETGKFVDRFSRKILPPKGRELEHLSTSMTKDMERQVKMGYFYLDRSAHVYRPTLKGAYFMTWKTIFKLFGRKKR